MTHRDNCLVGVGIGFDDTAEVLNVAEVAVDLEKSEGREEKGELLHSSG